MSDINISKFHKQEFDKLSTEIVENALAQLNTILAPEIILEIKSAYDENKEEWWASSHFGWGMSIRNFLRDKVCLDDKLPSGNWDDYYVYLVEKACGCHE